MCALARKEADTVTAVPLPAPAARKRPLAEPALPRLPPSLLPPFLSLPGAHTGATAQRLPKGKAGRNTRKRSSLCGVIILNVHVQLLRSKGGRPAVPGLKTPETCPSVFVGHPTPFLGEDAPTLPDAQHHTRLLRLSRAFPSAWHTDSHPALSPSPVAPRRFPQTPLSVQCGPGAAPGPAPQARAPSLSMGACGAVRPAPRPLAGVPGPRGSRPSPRPAVRAPAGLGGAAAGPTPGQDKPKGELGWERGP